MSFLFMCYLRYNVYAEGYNLHSVQRSPSVMSDPLRPLGLQHARLPCPSPTPGACSNSCPLSCWCHPTISSSVVPFSFCLQSFPESRSFLRSQFFTSSGQSIGAPASVLPMNIQDWFPFRLTGLISLQPKGLKSLLQHHSSKASVLQCWAFFMVQFAHPYLAQGRLFFPGSSGSKESACHTENLGSVPGSGGSHWGGNRNPPQ